MMIKYGKMFLFSTLFYFYQLLLQLFNYQEMTSLDPVNFFVVSAKCIWELYPNVKLFTPNLKHNFLPTNKIVVKPHRVIHVYESYIQI